MTVDEQLNEWVKGNSIHNDTRDECCPDFSCCDKNIDTPLDVRHKFSGAGEKVRMKMLSMFLGGMLSKNTDKQIHIAGDATTQPQN